MRMWWLFDCILGNNQFCDCFYLFECKILMGLAGVCCMLYVFVVYFLTIGCEGGYDI